LTYFESHRDDHEIANYCQEEEGEGERVGESVGEKSGDRVEEGGDSAVLDWQHETITTTNVSTSSPLHPLSVSASLSSTIVPLTRLKLGTHPSAASATDTEPELGLTRQRKALLSYGNEDGNEIGSFDERDS
jgi:hypothetical protein